jgi:hypothetical protein
MNRGPSHGYNLLSFPPACLGSSFSELGRSLSESGYSPSSDDGWLVRLTGGKGNRGVGLLGAAAAPAGRSRVRARLGWVGLARAEWVTKPVNASDSKQPMACRLANTETWPRRPDRRRFFRKPLGRQADSNADALRQGFQFPGRDIHRNPRRWVDALPARFRGFAIHPCGRGCKFELAATPPPPDVFLKTISSGMARSVAIINSL